MASRVSELVDAYHRSPDEARAIVRHALHEKGGVVIDAARFLGITRSYIWVWLRLLEMGHEPQAIRDARKTRYRLTDGRLRR
jgi:transposase-like protein